MLYLNNNDVMTLATSPLMYTHSPAKTASLLTSVGGSPLSKMVDDRGSYSALGGGMDFKLSGIVLL